jgi:hypothetical protein
MRKHRDNGVFIAEELYQLPRKVVDVRQPKHTFDTYAQWSKGCLVCSGINWKIFQKVAYVHVIPRTFVYYLQSIRLVVPPRMSTLQIAAYVWHFPIRLPE